jgi:hypothetical protein
MQQHGQWRVATANAVHAKTLLCVHLMAQAPLHITLAAASSQHKESAVQYRNRLSRQSGTFHPIGCVGVQYSGNVLVYSAVSPCDGDWFGGVDVASAEGFLDALADADISASGGVSEPRLRALWRGRISLSKEEQLEVTYLALLLGFLAPACGLT